MKKYIGRIVACTLIAFSGFASAYTQTGFGSSSRQYFDGDPYFNAPIAGIVNFTALQGSAGSVPLGSHMAVRFNRSQISANLTGSVSSANYSLFANTLNQGMILDFTPSQKMPFKFSAGFYQNVLNAIGTASLKNSITLSSQVTKSVSKKVGKQTVTQNVTRTVTTTVTPQDVGSLNVGVDYDNSLAPYAGFGWNGNYLQKRLTFSFDAGVIYVGDINVSVSSGNSKYAGVAAVQEQINLQAARIENNYTAKYLPVATLAMTYRF